MSIGWTESQVEDGSLFHDMQDFHTSTLYHLYRFVAFQPSIVKGIHPYGTMFVMMHPAMPCVFRLGVFARRVGSWSSSLRSCERTGIWYLDLKSSGKTYALFVGLYIRT